MLRSIQKKQIINVCPSFFYNPPGQSASPGGGGSPPPALHPSSHASPALGPLAGDFVSLLGNYQYRDVCGRDPYVRRACLPDQSAYGPFLLSHLYQLTFWTKKIKKNLSI